MPGTSQSDMVDGYNQLSISSDLCMYGVTGMCLHTYKHTHEIHDYD